MFLVKAGTVIQVQTPKSMTHFSWSGWMPYETKEDKIYDKEEVWDAITVHNGHVNVPDWAKRNIIEFNKVIVKRSGKYAMVNCKDIEFLD